MIISSLKSNSNENNDYRDILGSKDEFLNQILNIDQNKNNNNLNDNATKLHLNSVIGSKLINNNLNEINSYNQFNNTYNNDLITNEKIHNISNLNNFSQDNFKASASGDYNLLKSKNNLNDFSIFNNNNEKESTLSNYSKPSSEYNDDLVNNEDIINNINDFNSGN